MMSSKWVIKDKAIGLFFRDFEQDSESGEEVATWTSIVSKAYVFNREVDALFCLSFDDLHEEAEVVPYE